MIRQHPAVLLAVAALLLCLSVPGQAANTKWSNINPLPNFTDIKDVIWDGSSYYAVASGGLIITSPDGVNWTPQTLNVIHQLYGIAFSKVGVNKQYVVVGDRGLVATSTDGSSWTFQVTGVTTALLTIAWSPDLGLFVTGGSNGVLLTSPDGLSWTKQDSGFGAALEDVIWNGDRQEFITVTSGGGSNNIFTSTDGKTWIPRHISRGNVLRGIVWNGAQYVAVGANATVLTSPKGFSWTLQQTNITSNFTNITLFDIAWDGAQFVSVGITNFKDLVDPFSLILSSSDMVNWTAQNVDGLGVPKTSGQLQAVNWNGSRFLSVGVDTLLSSPDALSWTSQNSDVTGQSANLNAVAANGAGSLFVAVGANGAVISSVDGNSWTDHTTSAAVGMLALNSISWGSSNFVAVGENGKVITSPDGSTWTTQTSNTTANLNGITRGSIDPTTAIFVAVGDNGTVITSPDGSSWALQNSGTTRILKAITRDTSNNLFVAVGAGGIILTSPDGITWIQQTSRTAQNLNGIIRGGNELVAVGDQETVVSSLNGLNWQTVFLKTPNAVPVNLHAIGWNGTQYLIAADSGSDGLSQDKGGLLPASQDASTWIPNAQITTENLLATAWNGEQFVVVGTQGTILSSGIPDLAIKVAVTPMPAVQNQPLTFSSAISNTSGLIAPAVTWQYALPPGVSFDSVIPPPNGSCQEINNQVTCDLGDIGAGAERVSVTVKVIPGQVTLASNTATVRNTTDINLANNQATLVSTVNKEVIVLKNPDTTSSSNSVGALGPGLLPPLLLLYGWRRRQRRAA